MSGSGVHALRAATFRIFLKIGLIVALGIAVTTVACGPAPEPAPFPSGGPYFGHGPYDGPEMYRGGTQM